MKTLNLTFHLIDVDQKHSPIKIIYIYHLILLLTLSFSSFREHTEQPHTKPHPDKTFCLASLVL